MVNKPTKRTQKIILILLVVTGLIVGASWMMQWVNAQQEVKNIETTRQSVGQIATAAGGEWIDGSACYIANAHRFDSSDYYFCDTKYTTSYPARSTAAALELFDANKAKMSTAPAVASITMTGTDTSGETKSMYTYSLQVKNIKIDGHACALTYWQNKTSLKIEGEIFCTKEVSHDAYNMLAKNGYPITPQAP